MPWHETGPHFLRRTCNHSVTGEIANRIKKRQLGSGIRETHDSHPAGGAVASEEAVDRNLKLSAVTLGLTMFHAPILTLLTVPLGFYLSLGFFKDGFREIFREKRIGVGVIDTLTCGALLITSQIFTLVFFLVILFISQKVVQRTKDRSEKDLTGAFGEHPRTVWIEKEGVEVEILFEELQVGDTVAVKAGGNIPVDGKIVHGEAAIDQHMLTGESLAVEKGVGDVVLTSTTVVSGRILVLVEQTGEDTVAARIAEILRNTSDFKSSLETRGEKIANKTAMPTIALGGITYLLLGPIPAVAVLMAYFGYNMRISAPLSVLRFLQIASRQGILFKDGRAFESLVEVDTVVFDKTGTLTENRLRVHQLHCWSDRTEPEVLKFAAAAEHGQTHPVAAAILHEARRTSLEIPTGSKTEYEIGLGLRIYVGGHNVLVGSERFMVAEGIALPAELHEVRHSAAEQGCSLVHVAVDRQAIGAIELQPVIRPEAKLVIDRLKQRGLFLCIISGDHEGATRSLAAKLGITECFAQTLPEHKADLIGQLQKRGKKVCFVGDGINDSVALKKADVSISLQGASTIAVDLAQVILLRKDLSALPGLFDIADNLDSNMRRGFLTTIIPGLFCVYGVYFLHYRIFAAIVLYNIGLVAGVANALSPGLKGDSSTRLRLNKNQKYGKENDNESEQLGK